MESTEASQEGGLGFQKTSCSFVKLKCKKIQNKVSSLWEKWIYKLINSADQIVFVNYEL